MAAEAIRGPRGRKRASPAKRAKRKRAASAKPGAREIPVQFPLADCRRRRWLHQVGFDQSLTKAACGVAAVIDAALDLKRERPLTQVEIADALSIDPVTVRDAIRDLVAGGHLTTGRSPEDGRVRVYAPIVRSKRPLRTSAAENTGDFGTALHGDAGCSGTTSKDGHFATQSPARDESSFHRDIIELPRESADSGAPPSSISCYIPSFRHHDPNPSTGTTLPSERGGPSGPPQPSDANAELFLGNPSISAATEECPSDDHGYFLSKWEVADEEATRVAFAAAENRYGLGDI